jgi:hypothetical protein
MTGNAPMSYRDHALGVALGELDVPEHRPGFSDELRRRLADVQLEERGETPHRLRRRAARSWAPRVATIAAIAAIAVLALGTPVTDRIPGIARSDVASAAEVKAKVRASLGAMRTLSGVFVFNCPERACPQKAGERRWRFALTGEGDLRLEGPSRDETITYDASAGIVRSAQRSASIGGDTIFYAERRGVAPGPPDLGPPTWPLSDEFGAFVRALLAADDPRVRETLYRGRPAWRVEVDALPNAIVPEFTGDRFDITVDRETGMPVSVVERKNGAVLRELRVENLAVNADLPARTFRLDFPRGAEVSRSHDGFRRVDLRKVSAVVGYEPLVPTWVPDGYEAPGVAVATKGGPTGVEAGNPESRMVVSLVYRRGFDQFLVTTRLARPSGAAGVWNDPLATGEGFVDRREQVALRRGALRGARAEVIIVPRGLPHLWALDDALVVTVAGDLSRAELLGVAESLKRRTG